MIAAASSDFMNSRNATAAGYIPARDECKRQMNELGKKLRAKVSANRG